MMAIRFERGGGNAGAFGNRRNRVQRRGARDGKIGSQSIPL